jgi:hypothetical protein
VIRVLRGISPGAPPAGRLHWRWAAGVVVAILLLVPAPTVGRAAGSTWSVPVYLGAAPNAVSCTSSSYCVEASAFGGASTWNGTSWSAPVVVDGGTHNVGSKTVRSVSC